MNEELKLKKATYNLWTMTLSNFISSFGSQIYTFVISFYILKFTGSASNFAFNLLCSVLPRILVMPFAGVIADRFSRKKIVIFSHIGTIITTGILIIISLTIGLSLPIIFAGTAIFSLTATFADIAYQSSVSNLVDEDRIQRAMSLQSSVDSIAAIASPIIGGILYSFVGIPVFLGIYLVGTVIVTGLQLTMNFRLYAKAAEVNETEQESILQNIKQGLTYVKKRPVIYSFMSVALVANFLGASFNVGFSYVLIDNLQMPSHHFGIVDGSFAVGMLLMSIYLSVRSEIKNPFKIAKFGVIFMGGILGIFTLPLIVTVPYIVMFIFFIGLMFSFGANIALVNTPINVAMQKIIDDAYKGRVFSLIGTGAQALVPLGTILFGILYDIFPATYVMGSSGVILIGSALYLARPSILRLAQNDLIKGRKQVELASVES